MTELTCRKPAPRCSPACTCIPAASALDLKRPEVRAFIEETSRDLGFDARRSSSRCWRRPRPSRRSSMRSAARPSASCRGTSIATASSPRSASCRARTSGSRTARRCERIPDPNVAASVVGILGVETSFGRITGRYRVHRCARDAGIRLPAAQRLLSRRAAAVPAAVARGVGRSADGARLVRRRDGRAAVHLLQLSQLRDRRRRQRQARSVEQLGRRDRLGRELPARARLARRRAGRRHRDARRATT